MLRIGIDMSSLVYGRGVSRYTTNLVSALANTRKAELHLYGSAWSQSEWLNSQLSSLARRAPTGTVKHSLVRKLPGPLHTWLWQHGLDAIRDTTGPLDVIHSWDWLQPPDKHIPLVSTIHDTAIKHFPETAHPEVVRMHEASWRTLRQRQAHVIAVSQATRHDIVQFLEIPPERIHVVYEALPVEFVQQAGTLTDEFVAHVQSTHHLTRPFAFFVGTFEPRKNLPRLLQAWEPLSGVLDLVLAGAAGWEDLSKVSLSPQAKAHLHIMGKVDDATLMALYASAEMFVYPSMYEGFGLPILESFFFSTGRSS
jgi:glycosyltransferase involved in cell wall biosynthesis